MKKLLVLLIVLLLVTPALAATKHKKKKAKPVATPVETPVATAVETPVKTPVATPVAETSTSHWVLQLQGGGDFILSSTPEAITFVTPAWEGEGSFGYAFSDNFSLSLLSGYHAYPIALPAGAPTTMHIYFSDIPVQLVAQYNFGGDVIQFYGMLGAGLAFNNFYEMGSAENKPVDGVTASEGGILSQTDFLLSPGLGIAFKLSDKVKLFVQSRVDMNFYSQTLADFFSSFPGSTKKFDTPS